MFKFMTLYRQVDDVNALETFFSTVHLRLGEQLAGLRKVEISRMKGKPGGDSRFYMSVELYFDSAAAFEKSLASDEGIELMQALRTWYDGKLITWFYAEAWEEDK